VSQYAGKQNVGDTLDKYISGEQLGIEVELPLGHLRRQEQLQLPNRCTIRERQRKGPVSAIRFFSDKGIRILAQRACRFAVLGRVGDAPHHGQLDRISRAKPSKRVARSRMSSFPDNFFEMHAQLSHFLSRAIAALFHNPCSQSSQKKIQTRRELKTGQSRSSDSL